MGRRLVIPVLVAMNVLAILAWNSSAGARGAVQAREDQITILAPPELFDGYRVCEGSPTFQTVVVRSCGSTVIPGQELLGAVRFDRSKYVGTAVARLDVRFVVQNNGGEYCVRLFDITAGQPVTGSEVCRTVTDDATPVVAFSVRTDPLNLATTPHEYAMQARNGTAGVLAGNLFSARLIVEWTEKA